MKTNRVKQTIQAASMADVAFLLLIFFMIVTTIVQDEGIFSKLPEISNEPPIKVKEKLLMQIILNEHDLMVNNEKIPLKDFKLNAEEHLEKQGKEAIFSLKYTRGANYNDYIFLQNVLQEVYKEKRNELSLQKTNKQYSYEEIKAFALENEKYALLLDEIKEECPMRLVEDLDYASKK